MAKENILITGGTGFIGNKLTDLLIQSGYTVSILSRNNKQNSNTISYYKWDVEKNYIDDEAVLNADYIIHLAGENIAAKRWTPKRKTQIINSRENSIRIIYDVLKKNDKKLKAFISASGIGFYGAFNGETICSETTPAAEDFLGLTCQKWEAAADTISSLNIRTVKIRTGLVVGKNEGFLNKMIPIFKYGFGSVLGSGNQYMPWIHIDDMCSIYLQAIQNESMVGVYNAAINDNTTNVTFSKIVAKIYGYSIWLPKVPTFILEIVLGEMSKIITKGRRVYSDKIQKTGFEFKYKDLETALRNCLEK